MATRRPPDREHRLAEITARRDALAAERDSLDDELAVVDRRESETSELVERLLLDDDSTENYVMRPLIFRGRVVGEISVNIRKMFTVARNHGEDASRAAAHLARLAVRVSERAADQWLWEMYWNEQVDDWVKYDVDRLCRLLERGANGRAFLCLDSVQWQLRYFVTTPADVEKVAGAIARGLRSKATYFRGKRGRRKKEVDPQRVRDANRFARDVQDAARQAKKAASKPARRAALRKLVEKFLPDMPPKGQQQWADDFLILPPLEIGKTVAAERFQIARRRLDKRCDDDIETNDG